MKEQELELEKIISDILIVGTTMNLKTYGLLWLYRQDTDKTLVTYTIKDEKQYLSILNKIEAIQDAIANTLYDVRKLPEFVEDIWKRQNKMKERKNERKGQNN